MSVSPWDPSWQSEDFEIKEDNFVHEGFYRVKRLRLRHKCFSGEWSPWLVREQMRRADAAAILLFDPQLDKLVLIEQFRTGLVGLYPERTPWLLEIVAGLLEPGEDPAQTIQREAQEEAGCQIKQLYKIMDFFNSPGGFAEKTTLFYGTVDATHVAGVHGLADEHEDIKVHVLSSAAVLAALEKGDFVTSASTAIALQWFALQKKNNALPF